MSPAKPGFAAGEVLDTFKIFSGVFGQALLLPGKNAGCPQQCDERVTGVATRMRRSMPYSEVRHVLKGCGQNRVSRNKEHRKVDAFLVEDRCSLARQIIDVTFSAPGHVPSSRGPTVDRSLIQIPVR